MEKEYCCQFTSFTENMQILRKSITEASLGDLELSPAPGDRIYLFGDL